MGFYGDQILPRCVNVALRDEDRARAAGAGVRGPRRRGRRDRLRLRAQRPVLPARGDGRRRRRAGRRRLGARREARPGDHDAGAPRGARRAVAAVRGRRFDAALSTWTMCTIPDLEAALARAAARAQAGRRAALRRARARARREGAALAAPADPLQQRIFGGCHLDRPIVDSIRAAGFEVREWTPSTRRARRSSSARTRSASPSPPDSVGRLVPGRARQPHQPGASRPRRGARARPHRRPDGPPDVHGVLPPAAHRRRADRGRSATSSTCCSWPSPSTG